MAIPLKDMESFSKTWSTLEHSWQSPEKAKLKFSNEVSPNKRKSHGNSDYIVTYY